jgi:chemotaxis signal transduction protein
LSLPHLLLVDDSEAVLAFERAALSGHYAISTAMTGREALAKVPQIDPAGILAALFVTAGKLEVGLPLESVRNVLHQIATQPLPLGPSYLSQMVVIHGQPVPVLDLPRRLGVEHSQPVLERKLVVVEHGGALLALCVDEVRDPEELVQEDVTRREQLGGAEHGALLHALLGVARTQRGSLPLIDPRALVSRELLRNLADGLRAEAR